MKRQLLFLFAVGTTLMACGQTPPKKVETSFTQKFSNAQSPEWEQEGDEWEVEFKLSGNEMSASFDNNGKWLETESEVKKKDVPAEIFKAVTLKFEGWEIEEIERIEKPDFKGYEIALEKEETETEILVSDSAEITIKKVKVEEEHEEEDND
ncbi:PepSY-like domain-containing protein [Carboxylicivirga linearis]|uniref:PepSY-like domain-containing protein n=1 Tax=Carboxylicivirga linearis TaxID=1628157 RepID=A0ABS5K1D5_9BACT|nr:PepSY-like domain-containing protein [Carboxylicivirga linearis]MBS2100968.1 PepSY-like domain-containing protein [Carboxylicivirga linearis]